MAFEAKRSEPGFAFISLFMPCLCHHPQFVCGGLAPCRPDPQSWQSRLATKFQTVFVIELYSRFGINCSLRCGKPCAYWRIHQLVSDVLFQHPAFL
jgi:hypothetical protein